jgi:hypothetical protein
MSRRIHCSPARLALVSSIVASLSLAAASSSFAATATIGQLAPNDASMVGCMNSANPFENLAGTTTSGPSYVVPTGAAAVTSWSTLAASSPNTGQLLKFKVWRKVGEPATFKAVGHDGFQPLTAGKVNTFPVDIPVQPGDVIGLTVTQNSSTTGCVFDAPGSTVLLPSPNTTDFNDGESTTFTNSFPDALVNLSAVVAGKASNDFSLGKVKKNKNKGTAVLSVDVPGPGTLALKGTGVKAQRTGGATVSKEVTKAGTVTLKIKAKGAKKAKLRDRGKVKVKVNVTFTPAATGGDIAGDPNTETKKIKLVDN